ncbi:MAG TPA: SIS domain-containing protein [Levilinea sp.]|nr:SIS domain-containing protein [Levilinea sp.]
MAEIAFAERYLQAVISIVHQMLRDEALALDKAAELLVASLAQGGALHVFGAGHAHLFAEELAFRAGGLAAVNPIIDYGYTLMGGSATRSTRLERLEGYATAQLQSYDLRPGEVLLVVSQSGINPGPVEAALYAKEKAMNVIAVTSVVHSRSMLSRHSSGKRLFEIADVVIDNHIPSGDALVELRPGFPKVSAASTVVGAAILQALVAEVSSRLMQRGIDPPVWISSNVPEGDAHNQQLAEMYPARLKAV